MKYISEYFIASSGKSPVEEFIDSLDMRTQHKFFYTRSLLEEFGVSLGMPHCKRLKSEIYELRFKGKEGAVRVLYFFFKNNRIVFTNGFVKKTQKTPVKHIQTAIQRKNTFLEDSK